MIHTKANVQVTLTLCAIEVFVYIYNSGDMNMHNVCHVTGKGYQILKD